MIYVYVKLYELGKRKLKDIPVNIREKVRQALIEKGIEIEEENS